MFHTYIFHLYLFVEIVEQQLYYLVDVRRKSRCHLQKIKFHSKFVLIDHLGKGLPKGVPGLTLGGSLRLS